MKKFRVSYKKNDGIELSMDVLADDGWHALKDVLKILRLDSWDFNIRSYDRIKSTDIVEHHFYTKVSDRYEEASLKWVFTVEGI